MYHSIDCSDPVPIPPPLIKPLTRTPSPSPPIAKAKTSFAPATGLGGRKTPSGSSPSHYTPPPSVNKSTEPHIHPSHRAPTFQLNDGPIELLQTPSLISPTSSGLCSEPEIDIATPASIPPRD
ncbi:hypothetical protein EX30DRAFT_350031 [Ascodesmis nigricans]|uniref:Uncharacterized protein n=1 Tax=Ascodesmis nigricans TaxID=341454 RepID=A0A4S2MTH3_9PEZI|nr:hypothetical protein EX30DRAFT_350031 [Ascodesmis nigricans]